MAPPQVGLALVRQVPPRGETTILMPVRHVDRAIPPIRQVMAPIRACAALSEITTLTMASMGMAIRAVAEAVHDGLRTEGPRLEAQRSAKAASSR